MLVKVWASGATDDNYEILRTVNANEDALLKLLSYMDILDYELIEDTHKVYSTDTD